MFVTIGENRSEYVGEPNYLILVWNRLELFKLGQNLLI